MVALARLPLRETLPPHDFQVLCNARDAVLHPAPVGFQLRLAFAASHSDPAFLPRQVALKPRQPRQQMLQLRQLDLQLAFTRAGALGENVENQRSPIENLAVENLLEVTALGR